MATETTVSQRTSTLLDVVQGEIEDLPKAAAEWPKRLDWQQAEFALEWGHLMTDFLGELDEHYRAGDMTAEQLQQYRHVLAKLKALMPTIRRLGLDAPLVSLDP